MIDIVISIINGIFGLILIFVLKRLYYINHKISQIEVHISYIRDEIKELKEYIYRRLH